MSHDPLPESHQAEAGSEADLSCGLGPSSSELAGWFRGPLGFLGTTTFSFSGTEVKCTMLRVEVFALKIMSSMEVSILFVDWG